MKKRTSITAVLVLALLTQAAAAVVPAPCAMTAGDASVAPTHHHAADGPAIANAAGEHDAHHHAMASEQAGRTTQGDCCEGMTVQDCAAGCTAGLGTMLLLPLPVLAAVAASGEIYREPDWLPPYLIPTHTIFRPPIG